MMQSTPHRSEAKIISCNMEGEAVCASAAKMSTTLGNAQEIFDRTRRNPQNSDLIRKVLRSGHKSVIEHAVFSIAFWDVSVFVEQYLIECRLASFTVKSRRYVDFAGQGYYVPAELEGSSLNRYRAYMDALFAGYGKLMELGVPKEDARFLLPYAFCSNFYCTMNARELCSLIRSIRTGRGRNVPELVSLADQLTAQLETLFPALLSEVQADNAEPTAPTDSWHCSGSKLTFLDGDACGSVRLVQEPAAPMTVLNLAVASVNPVHREALNIPALLADPRPRALEHLSYSFLISDLTLSGITHLARHRMQSVIIPDLRTADHSRVILPRTIAANPEAKACYEAALEETFRMLPEIQADENLRPYGYYFTVSGNVLDVMSTMNARELLLFIRLRSCNRAQWEIRSVATQMLLLLRESFPALFCHYGPSCVLTGTCPEGRLTCGKKAEMIEKFRG